ncbi:MAG TPA: AI-2E family transporter [Chryseosolibacter sp.]
MTTQTYPPFMRISMTLLTIALLLTGLYLGRGILVPFFFACLLATVLNPLVNFLTRRKVDRVLAIMLCLVMALGLIFGVVYFLSTQIGAFLEDIPVLKERLNEIIVQAKVWVRENFNIGFREQDRYLKETTENMNRGNQPTLVQRTFITITELISYTIFLPVYTFLILYHKTLIIKFLTDIFKKSEEDKVVEVMIEGQSITQQYLTGLMIETSIVFALNTVGFLILGIKYPVFLALIAALLNIVPYIGMLIANVFCVMVTLVSADPSFNVLWVAGVLAAVQIVDNNVLMPFIVGSKIKINALALILAVVTGGAICGVPGMFLAVPGLAMLRVIFERVQSLKPWALLLSDEVTEQREEKNPLKRAFTKARERVKKKQEAKKKENQ